jgi:hypothetical protein
MLQSPSSSAPATVAVAEGVDMTRRLRRKRKAETQDNERLSKRLSLLNLGMFYSCFLSIHTVLILARSLN